MKTEICSCCGREFDLADDRHGVPVVIQETRDGRARQINLCPRCAFFLRAAYPLPETEKKKGKTNE